MGLKITMNYQEFWLEFELSSSAVLDPDYWYKFSHLMANSAAPEANLFESTLFAMAGHIRVQQDKG